MKELGFPIIYDAGVNNAGSTDMGTLRPLPWLNYFDFMPS
jgi:hypothetical protein